MVIYLMKIKYYLFIHVLSPPHHELGSLVGQTFLALVVEPSRPRTAMEGDGNGRELLSPDWSGVEFTSAGHPIEHHYSYKP